MNLGEVRKLLDSPHIKNLPDATMLVLSADAEGNNFSPLENYGLSWYRADTPYSGDVEGRQTGDSVQAIVLWPVN